MAALKDIAREVADEIRDGIAWVIVYRVGRSWHSLSIYSDIWNEDWEKDDLTNAWEILNLDPNAIALNGHYCGHFGDNMPIEQISASIRWHYKNGYNQLSSYEKLQQIGASGEGNPNDS